MLKLKVGTEQGDVEFELRPGTQVEINDRRYVVREYKTDGQFVAVEFEDELMYKHRMQVYY